MGYGLGRSPFFVVASTGASVCPKDKEAFRQTGFVFDSINVFGFILVLIPPLLD